jgi:hypothetical protein
MTPADAVRQLNADADWWLLKPTLNGDRVSFYVVGEVYPFKVAGERRQRGKRDFVGPECADAAEALVVGLAAMRDVESPTATRGDD